MNTHYRFLLLVLFLILPSLLFAQNKEPQHGKKSDVIVIIQATVVDGVGTPAEGPMDIVIRGNRIDEVTTSNRNADYRKEATVVIDASDKYVLPGLINMHGHLQDERAGKPMPFQYQYNLWLGSGITTHRDVGSEIPKAKKEREKSSTNTIVAPRILLYMWFPGGKNEAEIRANIRDLKKEGADGVKIHHLDRDDFRVMADEAKKQGLRIAHHVGA